MDQKNQDQIIIEEKISKTNGESTIKKYSRGKLLGKGGFAKVYEVTDLTTQRCLAAKIMPKNQLQKSRQRQKLISEIKIHKSLRHKHIVNFEHVFEDNENVYILLEICPNQTLNELIKRRKRLTELEVQCFLKQMLDGILYLHKNRVIHRDLKLGNLFLNQNLELKLGDFGLATRLDTDSQKKYTVCGTPNYIAPEVLDQNAGHSYEVDIWSLGVILYTQLIGKPPYETPDVKKTYQRIKTNTYSFPDHIPLSDHAKALISSILVLTPSQRPSLSDIANHAFLHQSKIPDVLPLSVLACPPSSNFVKQYIPQGNTMRVSQQPQRLNQDFESLSRQLSQDKNNQAVIMDLQSGRALETNGDDQQLLTGRPNFSSKQEMQSKDLNTKMFSSTNNLYNSLGSKMPNQVLTMGRPLTSAGPFLKQGTELEPTELYITKWIDYSQKYGMGYVLSNGSSGVLFNDNTKIIVDIHGQFFDYIEKQPNNKQDVVTSYSMKEYPKELGKKVVLLSHFKSYFEGEKKENQEIQPPVQDKPGPQIYVKKWMKTKHAVMFRLSNKVVQVNFTDKTEIILNSETKMVTYVNKKAQRTHHPLATALESNNHEMSKRLKYTKEILTQMLTANKNHENQETKNIERAY